MKLTLNAPSFIHQVTLFE